MLLSLTMTGYFLIYGSLSDTSKLNCAASFSFATKLTSKLSLTLNLEGLLSKAVYEVASLKLVPFHSLTSRLVRFEIVK